MLCKDCPYRMLAEKAVAPVVWKPQPRWDERLRFIRNQDLANDTMELIPQIPSDLVGVIGIPVSGMIPAAYLSRMLCLPLFSYDHKEGIVHVGDGRRSRSMLAKDGKYLVVDDTVYTGAEMQKVRTAMKQMDVETIFAVVYTKKPEETDLHAVHAPGSVILEWNIFNSASLAGKTLMPECVGGIATDFDGIICEEPAVSDFRQPDEFQYWLANARPQYIPRKHEIPLVVSFRIEPWRAVTEQWMKKWGVRARELVLHPAQTIQERERDKNRVRDLKARVFRESKCSIMFESDEQQARIIAEASGKTVIVPATGEIIFSIPPPQQVQEKPKGEFVRKHRNVPAVFDKTKKVTIPTDYDDLKTWFNPDHWKSSVIIETHPVCDTKQQDVVIYAIVSTWHEADVVEAAVKNCFAHGCEKVFIVDNDSPDDTRERAVAAGAEIAVNFHTEMYQEQIRIGHINKVMHDKTQEMCLPRLWWLTVDCDEFIQVPWGLTLKQFLERLSPECNVVGTKCIDHYPDKPLANIPGFHPAEFQPMGWYRGNRAFCALGHWKHPLVCLEAGEPSMVQTRGLHKPFVFKNFEHSGLIGPKECLWLHHFPFRNEEETRKRLGVLCKPDPSLGGMHRSIPDDKCLGGEGAIKRYRSLDAIYAYKWDEVELPHAQVTRKKVGVPVVHYSEFMREDEYKPLRWYTEEELQAAIGKKPDDEFAMTQFLCFELGRKCNMDKQHEGKCPSIDADRYGDMDVSRLIDDDTIVEFAKYAYDSGFTGEVAWHYYNEPLVQWRRMKALMERIKAEVPQARFCLWTNGTLIGRMVQPEELSVFEDVWVSNYAGVDWQEILGKHVKRVHVLDGRLDGRRDPLSRDNMTGCMRPYNEFILDNYGNCHLCCADWKGTTNLGNVFVNGFDGVAGRFFEMRRQVRKNPMPGDVPELCKRCTIREVRPGCLVPYVHERIK